MKNKNNYTNKDYKGLTVILLHIGFVSLSHYGWEDFEETK